MGYGNGIVDWGMQSAPLNLPPKINMSKWQAALDKARDDALGWRDKAIEVQADYDHQTAALWSWKETAMKVRDNYAPHLSNEDLKAEMESFRPAMKKKYWQEFSRKRTWDK